MISFSFNRDFYFYICTKGKAILAKYSMSKEKSILVVGAGKSSSHLIQYLLKQSEANKWIVKIADRDIDSVKKKLHAHPNGRAVRIDLQNDAQRKELIDEADIVVSLLPPSLHIILARDCVKFSTSLVTASYVSEEILAMDEAAKKAGIIVLNEMGADPGIDHMSSMEIIHGIHKVGGRVTSFHSFTGGLVSKESDDNPWHYKVAWNPWNIVRAGSAGGRYKMNGFPCDVSYSNLYKDCELIKVPGYGELAYYVNRDSYAYVDSYGLEHATTVLRGTLRHADFCKGWDVLVNLGLTDDKDRSVKKGKSFKDWFIEKSVQVPGDTAEDKISNLTDEQKVLDLLQYLEVYSDEHIQIDGEISSARVLQYLIEKNLKLADSDKDLIVMQHEVEYESKGIHSTLKSTMLVKGQDNVYTAMSKCVGLPMAIFVKNYLNGKFEGLSGVFIPTERKIYEPVLMELKKYGVQFNEEIS